MTEYEHDLFDLNGYLHIKNLLSAEQVAAIPVVDLRHRQLVLEKTTSGKYPGVFQWLAAAMMLDPLLSRHRVLFLVLVLPEHDNIDHRSAGGLVLW